MKREGRQHGVVRSYTILPALLSKRRHVLTLDSTPVAGIFTKVSRKPTNHSKFTGKCGKVRCASCRMLPVCKCKDKAKGTMKLRSIKSDLEVNDYPAVNSAPSVLAYLANNDTSYDDSDTYDIVINDYGYETNIEYGFGNIASVIKTEHDDEDEDESISYYEFVMQMFLEMMNIDI